jgi:protein-S-isoprenylcysteine O-methyltransferase Ste14
VPLVLGLPLWLQSYSGVLAGILVCLFMTSRILLEEKFLSRHLEGYAQYMTRVRWRILPGLW